MPGSSSFRFALSPVVSGLRSLSSVMLKALSDSVSDDSPTNWRERETKDEEREERAEEKTRRKIT